MTMAMGCSDRSGDHELKRCRMVAEEDGGRGRGSTWICDLPDDIITQILSRLTLKEAVSTSLLSRQWRYSWTSLPSLILKFPQAPYKYKNAFCQMVNQVLKLYKSPVLPQLSIGHHALDNSCSYYINSWFAFAIATMVSRFELELHHDISNQYVVPLDLFKGIEPYLARLYLYGPPSPSNIPIPSLGACSRFKSIRELVLKQVDFGDDVFEAALSSCSMLECLVLSHNNKLINAKYSEPLVHLRCLEIIWPSCLENLEISAPNLVSFNYRGPTINICIKDAHHLVELSLHQGNYPTNRYLGLTYPRMDDFVFSQFAAYLSCLEHLTINISFCLDKGRKIPIFSKLKRLTLFFALSVCRHQYYHVAAFLINASPCLHQLELNTAWQQNFGRGEQERPELLQMIPLCRHGSLKEILLDDYAFADAGMEFLEYLVGYTVAVEKIEIITTHLRYSTMYIDGIRERMPPNAQLVALERDRHCRNRWKEWLTTKFIFDELLAPRST